MTLTPDERRTIDEFKTGISLLRTGPDGFPLPGQALELHVLGHFVLKVDTILIGRSDLDAEERSLLNLADATSKLISATDSGDRDPAIPEAWFRARAELVEPKEWPGRK